MAPATRKTPSLDLIEEVSRYPPIISTSNPINSEFRATLSNILVLKDVTVLGAIYIQLHLSQTFSIPGWNWIVQFLSDNKFLVEPPPEG
jgi:hypothetical protein